MRRRYLLLKRGICNCASGCVGARGDCDPPVNRAGLFIVSTESLSPAEREAIDDEAERLAVSVLYP